MSRGMYQEARGVTNLILSETNQGNEDAAVLMVHAVASILIGHPERALKDLAKSCDRQRLRFPIVERVRVRPSGKMGGRARKVQERRILDRRAAAGTAAHRHRGCDAGLARGEGLCRGLAAAQRTRGDRHSQRDEARDRGAARAARRGAGARQGRARRLQVRGAVQRPAGVGRGEAAGGPAAAQARRTRPGRVAARTGDAVGRSGAATRSS